MKTIEYINQIKDRGLKKMLFSVYSIIEENGYIEQLNNSYGKKYLIDDFEYIFFNLTKKEENGIKLYIHEITDNLNNLMYFIEKEIQDNKKLTPKTKVFVNRDEGYVFLVNLKEFNLLDKLG